METIINETPDFKVSRVTTPDGDDNLQIQVTLSAPWEWYERFEAIAKSAGVSMYQFVTDCAFDGLVRGYR